MPDWLFRRLERVYLDERGRRDRERHERVAAHDRRIRYFYSWARFMHEHRQCIEDCPYAGH